MNHSQRSSEQKLKLLNLPIDKYDIYDVQPVLEEELDVLRTEIRNGTYDNQDYKNCVTYTSLHKREYKTPEVTKSNTENHAMTSISQQHYDYDLLTMTIFPEFRGSLISAKGTEIYFPHPFSIQVQNDARVPLLVPVYAMEIGCNILDDNLLMKTAKLLMIDPTSHRQLVSLLDSGTFKQERNA